MGIPIGPDTSLVIAESILCAADREITQELPQVRAFRHVDDFEFGLKSYSEAEQALATVQGVLKEYELELNFRKTSIEELPLSLEPRWVTELRNFNFRSTPRGQRSDLISYFDRVFDFAPKYPGDYVIKYVSSQ